MLENKKAIQWASIYQEYRFIFTNHRGNPISLSTINRNMQQSESSASITKHTTSHTIRHSHISLLSQLGVSPKAIMGV